MYHVFASNGNYALVLPVVSRHRWKADLVDLMILITIVHRAAKKARTRIAKDHDTVMMVMMNKPKAYQRGCAAESLEDGNLKGSTTCAYKIITHKS